MNSKQGSYEKNVWDKETHPDIGAHSFLHISLGLNSLPGSCDLHEIWKSVVKMDNLHR